MPPMSKQQKAEWCVSDQSVKYINADWKKVGHLWM